MKKNFLVLLMLIMQLSSWAQYKQLAKKSVNTLRDKQQIFAPIRQLLNMQANTTLSLPAAPNAKITTTMERVIGWSVYNYYDTTYSPFGRTDTTYLHYSSGRGSFYDLNTMGYNNYWLNSGGFIYGANDKNYAGVAYNNQPFVLSDTCFSRYKFHPSYSTDTTQLIYAFYDTNCNATEYANDYDLNPAASYPLNRSFNYYDGSGYISYSYILSWDYGTWDTVEYRQYFYDANHNIVKDSSAAYDGIGGWSAEYKWLYHYNSYGKFDNVTQFVFYSTTVFDSSALYIYTYYSDSTVKDVTVKLKDAVSGILKTFYVDTFGYTSGVKYTTYEKLSNYSLDSASNIYFAGYDLTTKHISSGLPDTVYSSSYSAPPLHLEQKSKTVMFYDSYNLPTLDYTYMWDTLHNRYDTTLDYIDHYYYETFTPSTAFLFRSMNRRLAVQNTTTQLADIKLYPNPATSRLYIDGAAPGTSVNIFNILGTLVYATTTQNELELINLQNFSPGVYAISLTDKQGNQKTSAIIKK